MKYSGIAQEGEGRGQTLGFPTVNIPLTDTTVGGIYAARVVTSGNEYFAAAYADQTRGLLEAHLLDFTGDLYGQEVTITLEKKIRDDARFTDEESLKATIAKDVQTVREYYKV
jgi:riboflavin kinase/FMN adenylyltransferase